MLLFLFILWTRHFTRGQWPHFVMDAAGFFMWVEFFRVWHLKEQVETAQYTPPAQNISRFQDNEWQQIPYHPHVMFLLNSGRASTSDQHPPKGVCEKSAHMFWTFIRSSVLLLTFVSTIKWMKSASSTFYPWPSSLFWDFSILWSKDEYSLKTKYNLLQ